MTANSPSSDALSTAESNSKSTQCTASSTTTKNLMELLRRRTNITLSAGPKKGYGSMSKEIVRKKIEADIAKYLEQGGTITQCPRGESEREIYFQDKS